jgi:hypothetical protein
MNRDGILNLAKNNCYTPKFPADSIIKYPQYIQYQRSLREKLINRIGLDDKKILGLLFVSDEVPDTNKCWLIWLVDTKGKGLVGYENQDSELQVFNSNLPKDKLEDILNKVNKL